MNINHSKTVVYDEEGINYDDIPEITDFTKSIKNPYVGKFIKNGKFTAEIEHDGYNEIVEYDIKTGHKTVRGLIIKDNQIVIEDKRVAV